jgi:hypothetical protein
MIKLVFIGAWGCGAMFASAYYGYQFRMPPAAGSQAGAANVEMLKTDMTSVPVIRDGVIQGYLIFQLAVAVDEEKKNAAHLDPMPYIVDEAFKAMYNDSSMDFTNLRKFDFTEMGKTIAANLNARFKDEIVRDVLIQNLNYVPKDNVRTNWTQKN